MSSVRDGLPARSWSAVLVVWSRDRTTVPYVAMDADGAEVGAVAGYLSHVTAGDFSDLSVRSYGLALLRWLRFLDAVDVASRQAPAQAMTGRATPRQAGLPELLMPPPGAMPSGARWPRPRAGTRRGHTYAIGMIISDKFRKPPVRRSSSASSASARVRRPLSSMAARAQGFFPTPARNVPCRGSRRGSGALACQPRAGTTPGGMRSRPPKKVWTWARLWKYRGAAV